MAATLHNELEAKVCTRTPGEARRYPHTAGKKRGGVSILPERDGVDPHPVALYEAVSACCREEARLDPHPPGSSVGKRWLYPHTTGGRLGILNRKTFQVFSRLGRSEAGAKPPDMTMLEAR